MWRYLGSSLFSNIQDTTFIQVALLTLSRTNTKGLISLYRFCTNRLHYVPVTILSNIQATSNDGDIIKIFQLFKIKFKLNFKKIKLNFLQRICK